MAVLVEAISVIVRRDAIERYFNGGWDAFQDIVPNKTLCTDNELARVGFMMPSDVGEFVDMLVKEGLTFVADDKFVDVAVVDQQKGPTLPTKWLEFGRLPVGDEGNRVSACWLYEGPRGLGDGVYFKKWEFDLAVPPGWSYNNSLSSKFTFVANEDVESRMKFLRREDEQDVYLDTTTGKEVYATRTTCSDNDGKPVKH